MRRLRRTRFGGATCPAACAVHALATWLVLAGLAAAFNMDPVARPRGLVWVPKTLLDKVKEPVHEIMTVIAYDCHNRPSECGGKTVRWKRTALSTKLGRLIDGVEWNDDPTLKLRALAGSLQWVTFMGDAEKTARCRREQKPGVRCRSIDASYDLLYRSHFGDLQFLHAMGSGPGEPAAETRAKMLAWAEYTYKLATKVIRADEPLARIQEPPIDRYIQRGNWTSRVLFTRDKRELAGDTPTMALGSLLHLVQDSYSDAHTHRDGSCDKLRTARGAIQEFHSYVLQDPREHGHADRKPEWLEGTMLGAGNPVTASAHVIGFALDGKPWKEVLSWLEKEVFALSPAPRASGAGNAACFGGNAPSEASGGALPQGRR